MKTSSHILLVIIISFFTLITKSQAASNCKTRLSAEETTESSNVFRIWIKNNSNLLSDEAVIGFWANAMETYENYDSHKMFAVGNNYPQTYTLTSDNHIVAINGEPILAINTEQIIPLGFLTYMAGTFTYTATNLASFDPTILVYLEDLQQNILQDLRINNTYEFTSGIASNAARFRLHYIKTANAVFNAGAILTAGETICYNSDPSVIGSSTTASGGDGSITYQWQSSTDALFTAPVTIGSSNSATYDPPAGLTVSTWYRRQAKDGSGSTGFISSEGVWAVTVNPVLPVSVNIAASPGTTVCPGTSVTFTATATNGGATPSYQWKNNGNNISGATNSTYTSTALSNGNLIACVITSSAACTAGSTVSSNTLTMSTVYLQPGVSIAASPGTTVNAGTSVTLTATPANGGTASAFQWKINGNNISGATNSTYTFTAIASLNNKKFTCVMTSGDLCTSGSQVTSNILKMTVKSSPKSQTVQVISEDSVPDDASSTLRISDGPNDGDISIYPNPATSSITLDFSGYQADGNYELRIYSIDGKQISFADLNEKTAVIDVTAYDAGVYYLRIENSNVVLTRKFIKE